MSTEVEAGSTGRGLRAVLISTIVAGVVGYVIQIAAPALLSTQSAYVSFSVFWSTLYLWVASLAGIQQEVARATHPTSSAPSRASPLRTFAACAAVVVALAAILFAAVFGDNLVHGSSTWFAVVLPIGLIGYVLSASLGGVLYGLRLWSAVAFTTIADALLRAALVLPGLFGGLDTGWLALLVVIPFGLAFVLTWVVFRRRVVAAFELDVDLRGLTRHSASTVAAATASGLMISGLPMLIGATSAHVSASVTGSLLLTITLTRAPIVVPVIALQSFLIATVFRGGGFRRAALIRVVAIAAGLVALLAAAAWLIGPAVVSFISGGRFSIPGWIVAVIVVSAGLTAAMCTTGPALISMRRHVANLVGWIAAAALTVGALLLPIDEIVRVPLALTIPVVVGLAIHAIALGAGRRGPEADGDAQ